jgi:hypothetical protein
MYNSSLVALLFATTRMTVGSEKTAARRLMDGSTKPDPGDSQFFGTCNCPSELGYTSLARARSSR